MEYYYSHVIDAGIESWGKEVIGLTLDQVVINWVEEQPWV